MSDITIQLIAFKQVYMYGRWVNVRVFSPASQGRYTLEDKQIVRPKKRRACDLRCSRH